MNRSDSEEMAGRLLAAGCAEAPSMDAADLVVINTCAIREAAEAKVIGRQGHLGRLKAANPAMRVVLTGCSVRESNRAGLARRYPAVDLFLRPDEEPELVDRLGLASAQAPVGVVAATAATTLVKGGAVSDATHLVRARADAIAGGAVSRASAVSAWLPIIYGCDKTCTYCIVPVQPGPGAEPPVRRDRRRGPGAGRCRLSRGDAPRPERQQLRPRPAARGALRARATRSGPWAGAWTARPGPTSPS